MCVVGSGSRRWSRGSSRIRIRAMPPPSESHYLLTGVSKTLILAFTTQPGDTRRRGLQRQSVGRSHEAKGNRRRRATCAPPFSSLGSAQRASKSVGGLRGWARPNKARTREGSRVGDRVPAGRRDRCGQEAGGGGGADPWVRAGAAPPAAAQVQDVLSGATADGRLAGRPGCDAGGDGGDRGVLAASVSCPV